MSSEFSPLLNRLLDRQSLTEAEASSIMHAMASGDMPHAVAGALLAALRSKGETAEEIRGFATAMRELALHPVIPRGAPTVDTVGTGGDGSGSLNLSTGAGLLAAACGARVVKHGNRSISSRSGSADVLECLGMPLPLDETAAVDCLQHTIRYSRCCQPVPGDPVVGYITRGRGVSIHRNDCPNVLALARDPERRMEIEWAAEKGDRFFVKLYMQGTDRRGLLSDVAKAISDTGTDISHADMRSSSGGMQGEFVVEVRDLAHLEKVRRAVGRVKGVLDVQRRESFDEDELGWV
jgi:hypothetical protein